MDIRTILINSDIVVKCVIVILILFSIISWGLFIFKFLLLKISESKSDKFYTNFIQDKDLDKSFAQASSSTSAHLSVIYIAGYKELKILCENNFTKDCLDNIQRAMLSAKEKVLIELENKTPILATIGSASPFVGLFGTVWGIMNSFIGLSNKGSATLNAVAPGIAEALIATAIGLFAAIPAVMFYNNLTRKTARIEQNINNFIYEFTNIVFRVFLQTEKNDDKNNKEENN